MNNIDKQYQNLLIDILTNGIKKEDRTGTGTISLFGRQIRHKMSEGFPLLTTKKMYVKGIITELLWFLKGETNIKWLIDNDCNIWNGDAYKKYLTEYKNGNPLATKYAIHNMVSRINEPLPEDSTPFSMEDFVECIEEDESPELYKDWGELGPIYGFQWRNWGGKMEKPNEIKMKDFNGNIFPGQEAIKGIDQIKNLINDLKTNPDSRRLMVNAWNVGEIDQMTLPPCHYGFQCWTKELTLNERQDYLANVLGMGYPSTSRIEQELIEFNVPKRSISLMWNQRSCDFPLGIPYNIASYALLLEIIAREVNMIPDELIGSLGDCHIYSNQINGVNEQISRDSFDLPLLKIKDKEINDISEYEISDFVIENYKSHPKIDFPLSN